MLARVLVLALLVSLCGVSSDHRFATAQVDKGPLGALGVPDKKKDEPTTFEIRMVDDTVMKVVLLEPALTVATRYGKLSVPANELRRLDFGFRYPEGVEAKVDKAIADLGAPEFRTREDAEQALADLGKYAVPALRRAARSEDAEVNRRAKAVLKLLEGKLGAEGLDLRDQDIIETAEFTIKGRLDASAMKVRTKHFGDATVKLTDIRTFRAVGSASSAEFALDAGKYAKMTQNEWMETALEVGTGQQLEVTATGRIDQWPQGPGQYMCSPEGQGGGVAPGRIPIGVPGQVIGRIGANGQQFAIGASYKGKPGETGKLYLRIGGSPWNCESSGSYKVTVNVTTP